MPHPNDALDLLEYPPAEWPYIDGEAAVLDTPFTKGPCRAVWVGGAGTVSAVMWPSGTTVDFLSVPAGTELRICCTQVDTIATPATSMVALY